VLRELAIGCRELENTEVVVISRNREAHEGKLLEELTTSGFVELTSYLLPERKATDTLRHFGIEASAPVVELSRNLLNLSLIVTIKDRQPDFNFSAVTDEVDLWQQYMEALKREEGAGINPGAGEELIGEAVELARRGLLSSDRTFVLQYPHSPTHKRLISWQIIVPEAEEDIHRFRHEKLQDFLVAWGAVRRGDLPQTTYKQFNAHRTRNVLVWMDKLYARRSDPPRRKRFLKEVLSGTSVPFYTQAAVLDRYVKSDNPTTDTDALEIIVEALRADEGLRNYFFRRGPHPAWVHILWDRGFFKHPPKPQRLNDNFLQPFWVAQEYLISVAPEVPEIILKHALTTPEDSGYIAQAFRALCFIPGEMAEAAVPRVLALLEGERTVGAVLGATLELIKHLVAERRFPPALDLFRKITTPKPAPSPKKVAGFVLGAEAVSVFNSLTTLDKEAAELIDLLKGVDYGQVVVILEDHLCAAVELEATTKGMSDLRVWDVWEDPLDDTGPYMDREYKNHLVRWLRKILEEWVAHEASAVRPLIKRYIRESKLILRRLGFHLLQKFPELYKSLVARELRRVKNFEDFDIRDGLLKLLQNGYSVLSDKDRQALISRICRGLPPGEKRKWRRFVEQEDTEARSEYVEGLEKRWIRDRLAMLKEHLHGEPALMLQRLIVEIGEPDYPGSHSKNIIAYHVSEVSPLSDDELAAMSPDDLIPFLRRWESDPERQSGPQQVTTRGLARAVADVMLTDLNKFGNHISEVASIRHEFAGALLDRLTNTERYPLTWESKIALCERLLGNEFIRTDVTRHYDGGWTGVRQTMIRLIETWFDESKRPVPSEYLPRVREMLLILVDDPDPQAENDPTEEDPHGEKSPSFISINHVRPSALNALINYAWYKIRLQYQMAGDTEAHEAGPSRLEPVVQEALTRKLDRGHDPSWAVHSIYGRHLTLLFWLDQLWLEAHVEDIFPEDEKKKWFYAAAWDSYVRFTVSVSLPCVEILRPKYERAIEHLSTGIVTRTSAQPGRDLAGHLLIDYLHADYDLRSPAGENSLIAKFYAQLSPSEHADAAWVLWSICNNNRDILDTYWPRARALWQWRVDAASAAGHPTDFDAEMNWFSLLLKIAQERETMTSLWPLLEGILAHIARPERRDHGWDTVEKYLSKEVERDTVNAIRYYHLMHAQRREAAWSFFGHKEADKIIETAAESEEGRQEALDLIDLLGRHRNYRYLNIYNRYAG
jgi:hypothetical protein